MCEFLVLVRDYLLVELVPIGLEDSMHCKITRATTNIT
jgi:hypothetical protein